MSLAHCLFCLATRADVARGEPLAFYWTGSTGGLPNMLHPAEECTYGGRHEFPEVAAAAKAAPAPKRDAKLCLKCGLHPRNPAAASNGCEHAFEALA